MGNIPDLTPVAHCQRTQAYAAKRTADGLNRRETLRCLKRYIARETYHALRADLEALNAI